MAVKNLYPSKQVRVVYDVKARISQNFTTKDTLKAELKSGIVYEAACPLCNDKYIGKTCRHFQTRINEHLLDQKKVMLPTIQPSLTRSNQGEPPIDNYLIKNVSTYRSFLKTK